MNRQIVLKENYLALVDWNPAMAEFLVLLEQHPEGLVASVRNLPNLLLFPISKNTCAKALEDLIRKGIVISDTYKNSRKFTLHPDIISGKNPIEIISNNLEKSQSGDRPTNGKTVPKLGRKRTKVGTVSGTKKRTKVGTDRTKVGTVSTEKNPPYDNTSIITTSDTQVVDPEELPPVHHGIYTGLSQLEDSDSKVIVTRGRKKKKNSFYDWTHYSRFSQDDWDQAKKFGILPGKEKFHTLIIGAYLLGIYNLHGVVVGMVPADFQGKYGKQAQELLEFFIAKNDGDPLAGFREALEYVREFVSRPRDSWDGKLNWPINRLFQRDLYRDFGSVKLSKGYKKINDTGIVIMTPEEREARQKHVWTPEQS